MPDKYAALITDVAGEGIRLQPEAAVPEQANDSNLLAMSVALALGRAGYEHHPEPRNPELQTIEALLAGTAVMPWRAGASDAGTARHVMCERLASGAWQCEVRTEGTA
jgi:hypothetical protein